jgi:hypothetical protein
MIGAPLNWPFAPASLAVAVKPQSRAPVYRWGGLVLRAEGNFNWGTDRRHATIDQARDNAFVFNPVVAVDPDKAFASRLKAPGDFKILAESDKIDVRLKEDQASLCQAVNDSFFTQGVPHRVLRARCGVAALWGRRTKL